MKAKKKLDDRKPRKCNALDQRVAFLRHILAIFGSLTWDFMRFYLQLLLMHAISLFHSIFKELILVSFTYICKNRRETTWWWADYTALIFHTLNNFRPWFSHRDFHTVIFTPWCISCRDKPHRVFSSPYIWCRIFSYNHIPLFHIRFLYNVLKLEGYETF